MPKLLTNAAIVGLTIFLSLPILSTEPQTLFKPKLRALVELSRKTASETHIPHHYRDEQGRFTHYCNEPEPNGEDPRPQTHVPFGAWKINDFLKNPATIFLVTSKDDALSLWRLGKNAVALEGVSNWHDNNITFLKKFDEIVALIEPNTEGKNLLHCLKKVVPLRKQLRVVELGPYKNFKQLHESLMSKSIPRFESNKRVEHELDALVKAGVTLDSEATRLSTPEDKATGEKRMIFTYGKYETWVLENEKNVKKIPEDVLQGIKVDPDNPSIKVIPSATLTDYAIKKLIPLSALKDAGFEDGIYHHKIFGPVHGVKMFSFWPTGKPAYFRFRISMDSAQPSTARFPKILFKPNGEILSPNPYKHKLMFYGLENLHKYQQNGQVFLVEGESDTLSMLYNGLPAFGVPGTASWDPTWNTILKKIRAIYVTVEDDEGGDHFLETVHNSPFKDRVVLVDFTSDPNGPYAELKDPSDLHVGIYTKLGRTFLDESKVTQLERQKNGKILIQKEILDQLMSDPNSDFIKEARSIYQKQLDDIRENGIPWTQFEPGLVTFLKENQVLYAERRKKFDKLNDALTAKRDENYELYKRANDPKETPSLAEKKRLLSEWARINDGHNAEHKKIIKEYLPTPYLDYYNLARKRTSLQQIRSGQRNPE